MSSNFLTHRELPVMIANTNRGLRQVRTSVWGLIWPGIPFLLLQKDADFLFPLEEFSHHKLNVGEDFLDFPDGGGIDRFFGAVGVEVQILGLQLDSIRHPQFLFDQSVDQPLRAVILHFIQDFGGEVQNGLVHS